MVHRIGVENTAIPDKLNHTEIYDIVAGDPGGIAVVKPFLEVKMDQDLNVEPQASSL